MVRFTLKQLIYFIAVAENGGIAQAARALHISQPATAQAVDKLEEITGLTLFIRRHSRGVEMTRQGEEFLRLAHRLVESARQVERDIASIAADLSGKIRFGCFHTISPFHAARLVKGYRSLYPKVEIEVSEERQDELIAGLQSGRIDLALLYDMTLDPTRLEWHVVTTVNPYVVLPAGHALASQATVRLQDLRSVPYVLFDGPGSRDYFRTLLAKMGINPPVSFKSESFESVRSAVGNGLGFSILAMKPSTDQTYDGKQLEIRSIAENIEPIRIVLAQRRNVDTPALVRNFVKYCLSNIDNTA